MNLLILALAAAVATPATSASSSTVESRVRAEIMPAFERMQAAANRHDADAHVAYFARDPRLIFLVGDRRIVGWKALLEQQRKWWPEGRIDPQTGQLPYKLIEGPDVIVLDARSALLSFMLDAPKANADGKTVDRTLAVSQLWQKRPEGWRVIYAQEAATIEGR